LRPAGTNLPKCDGLAVAGGCSGSYHRWRDHAVAQRATPAAGQLDRRVVRIESGSRAVRIAPATVPQKCPSRNHCMTSSARHYHIGIQLLQRLHRIATFVISASGSAATCAGRSPSNLALLTTTTPLRKSCGLHPAKSRFTKSPLASSSKLGGARCWRGKRRPGHGEPLRGNCQERSGRWRRAEVDSWAAAKTPLTGLSRDTNPMMTRTGFRPSSGPPSCPLAIDGATSTTSSARLHRRLPRSTADRTDWREQTGSARPDSRAG
jgi:hypothetical protein